jgi:hypothetical protein
VTNLYIAWIRIDDTLPWIELKGAFETRREAKKMAEDCLSNAQIRIVSIQTKREPVKALATAET